MKAGSGARSQGGSKGGGKDPEAGKGEGLARNPWPDRSREEGRREARP
jgi:hypothetical protein